MVCGQCPPYGTISTVDVTEGVLGLGWNVGIANKTKDFYDLYKDWTNIKGLFDKFKYDPFDFGITVGASAPYG
jgi:hypothetical protein